MKIISQGRLSRTIFRPNLTGTAPNMQVISKYSIPASHLPDPRAYQGLGSVLATGKTLSAFPPHVHSTCSTCCSLEHPWEFATGPSNLRIGWQCRYIPRWGNAESNVTCSSAPAQGIDPPPIDRPSHPELFPWLAAHVGTWAARHRGGRGTWPLRRGGPQLGRWAGEQA